MAYLVERLVPPPEDRVNDARRERWLVRHRKGLIALVCVLCTVCLWAATWLPVTVLAGSACVGAIGLAYALPGGWRIKRLARVKPLLIGSVWSASVVGLPLLVGEQAPDQAVLLLVGRMLFYSANALALDWPDRVGDERAGLRTWATRIERVGFRVFVTSVSFGAATACLNAGVAGGRPLLGAVDALGPLLLTAGLLIRLPRSRRTPWRSTCWPRGRW